MKTFDIIIVQQDSDAKIEAIKAFMEALKLNLNNQRKPYDPDLVAEILQGDEDFKNGKVKNTLDELNSLWK